MLHVVRYMLVACFLLLGLSHVLQSQPEAAFFSDRQAILETIENFYIGDHTGSLEHKKKSLHPQGAYRYVDKNGEYKESQFRFTESRGDTLYKEELLSIEIYETVALARLRLENQRRDKAEYKLMTLHKSNNAWLITGISWGWGVTQ